MWLYYWEKYGYDKAQQIFTRDYIKDKGHVKHVNAQMSNVLAGKLEYLKMVKGEENSSYVALKERLEMLSEAERVETLPKVDLETVINAVIEKGLDEGLNLYNRYRSN